MQQNLRVNLIALVALIGSNSAFAQSACDCTRIIGSCQATASAGNSFIDVSSDAEQCARVDYLVDGRPFVTLVVDGSGHQDSDRINTASEVIVQSCQVCAQTVGVAEATAAGSGLFTEGEAIRLIEVEPVYPANALTSGIEGYVEVQFTVSSAGIVSDTEVLDSSPTGVFEQAALSALNRWRYTNDSQGESHVFTERFDFTLDDALFSLRPNSASPDRPAPVTEARRNSCIQQESRYDFGAMVDISLINACEEPLIVYSCAAGFGSLNQRWVCQNPERNQTALRSSRLGAPVTATATVDSLTAIGRLEISHAPNGEYWWLACRVNDDNCRSDGREWVRSLDRQIANIDPQDRTRARLARSF